VQVVRNNLRGLKIVTVVEKSFTWKTLACACGEGGYAVPQASACCAKSRKFSVFPGVDPAQQQVRLNVTGVLDTDYELDI